MKPALAYSELFHKTSVGVGPVGMANLQFFSCILLALCTLSSSANDFISIDCGSSVSYEDENGIMWTGDDEYMKTGESRSVQPSESFDRLTDTLRVFTNPRKNCYNISLVKAGRVLVRTTFYYGNYDGKSAPPIFILIHDGTYLTTVNNSGPTPSRYEITYLTKKEWISVCVAQYKEKEGQFPYISALEVRSLEAYMYSGIDESYSLGTRRRVDYGANATIIRFPNDPYDRRWFPEIYANDTINISSEEIVGNAMVSDDEPPPTVLKTAVTSNSNSNSNSSRKLTIPILIPLPPYNMSVYINMYFCEVIRLKPNQTRSFYVYKDNQRFSPLISPPYGNCTRINFLNLTVSSNTTFSLVATENSTLPPLINASEVLQVADYPMNNLTDANDVQGLALLQATFGSLKDWSGDPCVPTNVEWDWVRCNVDSSVPRVTSLVISGYGLSGLLPDFSSMDALHTINLSNNSLGGNIPDFLGELPSLQILNLENNQFNGTIPASLLTKKGLILRVSGNPELVCPSNISCQQVPANSSISKMKKKKKNILQMLFTIIIPSIILLQSKMR